MLINIYKSLTFQLFWEKTFIKNQRLLVGFYADMISFISRCLSVVFLFSKTFDTDHGNAYCYLFLFIESLTGCGILMTELIFVTKIMNYIHGDKIWHVEKFWEILPQSTRFYVEKNWAQKYIYGEQMTNMRSDWWWFLLSFFKFFLISHFFGVPLSFLVFKPIDKTSNIFNCPLWRWHYLQKHISRLNKERILGL